MIWIRSALFNAAGCVWTVVLAVAFIPLAFAPRRWLLAAVRRWIGGLFALQRTVLGLDFEFRGRENLPAGGFLIASAHQSAWDTIGFYAVLDDPAFVLKKELYATPLFGSYARRLGMIAIDRRGGAGAARRMVREVSRQVAAGRTVIVFPGGTRSPPDDVVPMKAGIGALYRTCGVPVVPVSLNSGVFWARRAFLKRPGTIVAEIGEPIPPGLPAEEFADLLSRRIHDGNRRLVAEARAS